MGWISNWFKAKPQKPYAFTMWIRVPSRERIKIGVPIGITLGELEDQLYEKYPGWSTDRTKEAHNE
jgi:hypothetical protein